MFIASFGKVFASATGGGRCTVFSGLFACVVVLGLFVIICLVKNNIRTDAEKKRKAESICIILRQCVSARKDVVKETRNVGNIRESILYSNCCNWLESVHQLSRFNN